MPTFGAGAHGQWGGVRVAAAYRRTLSPTADAEGPESVDVPAWGTNQEHVVASARGTWADGAVATWLAGRYSLLLAQLDEASVGVRVGSAAHAVLGEYRYSAPSFDGDSIFNLFSAEPFQQLTLTYEWTPPATAWRGYARALVRRFQNTDTDAVAPGVSVDDVAYARGAHAGARWKVPGRWLRVDTYYEDGYGGLKVGGDLAGALRVNEDLELESRLTLVGFDAGVLAQRSVTFGAQAGGRWWLAEGVSLHLLAEDNATETYGNEFRLLGILDMTFWPET